MTKEELLKKIDFEKSWLYDCGIFGSDIDIAFHAIKNSVIETLEQEECEDCISRKEALKLFEDRFIELQKVHQKDKQYGVNWCINTLKDLPSVNPQNPKTDRVEYGTDGNAYILTISNGKEFEQEPFINKPCVSSGVCEHDKNKVLDKIRAEIVELTKCPYGTECLGANCPSNTDCMLCGDHVLEIIDKYKAESEDKE